LHWFAHQQNTMQQSLASYKELDQSAELHMCYIYPVSACRDAMIELECACDGGKDSLSMAAAAGGETVMAPGNLVVSAYVGCPDITKVVTPDLKMAAAGGVLLHVDLASVPGARRLGGSALAQAYSQVRDAANIWLFVRHLVLVSSCSCTSFRRHSAHSIHDITCCRMPGWQRTGSGIQPGERKMQLAWCLTNWLILWRLIVSYVLPRSL
jgi:phosphoribosylformylglycinamidine (FGAM) synthase-like enzyme